MKIIRSTSINVKLLERRGEDQREADREPVFEIN